MTKSTITRERLEKIKSWRETYGAGSNVMLPAEEAEELARMALAAMDSEPVSVTDDELNAALQLHRLKVDGHSQLSDAFRAGFRYARRSTPQPASVVPDDLSIFEAAIEECKTCDSIDEHAWNHGVLAVMAKYDACRAAMLNGGKS
jgi:hypothetical protein